MDNETNELMDYLYKISHKSLHGDIPWNQQNPSTFQWIQSSDNDHFQVTIQKAATPPLRGLLILEAKEQSIYLFQVQDKSNKQTVISLSHLKNAQKYIRHFQKFSMVLRKEWT